MKLGEQQCHVLIVEEGKAFLTAAPKQSPSCLAAQIYTMHKGEPQLNPQIDLR